MSCAVICLSPARIWSAALVVMLLLAACSSPGHGSRSPTPSSTPPVDSRTNRPVAVLEVDSSSRLDVPVAGTQQDPMWIRVEPGDFDGRGSIGSTETDAPPPSWPGFIPAGPARDVAVVGLGTGSVELSFAAGAAHSAALPVIWRQDEVEGWYPIAVGDPGATAVADRSTFSPHQAGVVDVDAWTLSILSAAGRWAAGRTTPPKCATPPHWAELTKPTLRILLTCVEPNTAKGVTRAELKVKNNRGLVQQIELPAGIAYASVQNQPDSVRNLVRSVAGGRDVVLLPSGDELRVGFERPPKTDRKIGITPHVSPLALLTELVLQLANLAEEGARWRCYQRS